MVKFEVLFLVCPEKRTSLNVSPTKVRNAFCGPS